MIELQRLALPLAMTLALLSASGGPLPAQPQQPAAAPDAAQPEAPVETPRRSQGTGNLPKLAEMPVPTMESLLRDDPIDWVVLDTDSEPVIVVVPISPRPDTLAKLQARYDELTRNAPPASDQAKRQEWQAERNKLRKLTLFLVEEPETPYEVETEDVNRIIYHEDLLLMRVDLLIRERSFRKAFELLFLLKRREPGWPGLDRRQNDLLFAEAGVKFDEGQLQPSLVMLEELAARQRQYAGLLQRLGQVVDALVSESAKAEDWRRARHFLARLSKLDPQHETALRWQQELSARASETASQAQDAAGAGRHDAALALARTATRIWPAAAGVRPAFERAARRFQQVRVGVTRLAGEPTSFPLPSLAEQRVGRLLVARLFELDHLDYAPRYRSRFLEQWEPDDLGRRAVFQLRQGRSYWESQPVVTAQAVVSTLARRLDPRDPTWDERLASYIRSIATLSPYEFRVEFARVPLRTEMVLDLPVLDEPAVAADERERTLPVSLAAADMDAASARGPTNRETPGVLTQRFTLHERADDRAAYRRTFPEPDGVGEYHIAEVLELKYDSADAAVQGLLRGEVSLLPHLQSWDVAELEQDSRFFLLKAVLPVTHLVQFNPRSKPLRHREYRRALIYAIDRAGVLDSVVLHGEKGRGRGRLTTAAWSTASYAYNSLVVPRQHDATQALALALAAKAALGDELPRLRMVCDPDPVAREAAQQLIAQWQRIGVTVELLPDDGPPIDVESDTWDLIYRRLQLAEPITGLWPLLVLDDRARVDALAHLPDWLRQKLIALDDETNWNNAVTRVKELQQDLWGEALWIPLWEVDEYMVVRKNIRGLPESPVSPYHEIEQWVMDPWYPTETP